MAISGGKGGGMRRGGGKVGKPASKKGATKGSGGQGRQALEGRKPTPKASERTGHPAARRAASAARRAAATAQARPQVPTRPQRSGPDAPEVVVGRNAVVEALRTKVPATVLHVALGMPADDRVSEAAALAGKAGIPVLEVSRADMDRMTSAALHQGLALTVPPYAYLHVDDLLERATASDAPLLVALDGVTDPRNLGAVVRSAAAFGAQGVLVPERRAAGMTAAAWRTSAGAAARLPVAKATNLVRALGAAKDAGLLVAGLAADGDTSLDDFDLAVDPLLLVVGSEGDGLGRLVGETCDVTVSVPMTAATESLNAGIAAAVVLAEVARRRRQAHPEQ